jgi:hypothetical protein
LVYSIYDSTEVAIKKTIEASQKMINEQLNNPPVNEHFKLQITLKVVYYLVVNRKEEDKIIAPRSLSVKSSFSKKRKGRESLSIYSVLLVQRLMDFGSLFVVFVLNLCMSSAVLLPDYHLGLYRMCQLSLS